MEVITVLCYTKFIHLVQVISKNGVHFILVSDKFLFLMNFNDAIGTIKLNYNY